jgi:hypothetical protein
MPSMKYSSRILDPAACIVFGKRHCVHSVLCHHVSHIISCQLLFDRIGRMSTIPSFTCCSSDGERSIRGCGRGCVAFTRPCTQHCSAECRVPSTLGACCTVLALSTQHEPPPLAQLACWALQKEGRREERQKGKSASSRPRVRTGLDYVDSQEIDQIISSALSQ